MQTKPVKKKIRRIVRLVLWILLVQFVLINISAAFYARKLTYLEEGPPPVENGNRNIFKKTWKIFVGPRLYKLPVGYYPSFPFDTVKLKTKNGRLIDGWYSKTDSAAKGTVILFHGVTSNKTSTIDEANEFRYLGYNVFLVDFRSHGLSEGKVTTIGVREAEDVKLAYDYVSGKGEKRVFLWGLSMGAVAICKAVSDYNLTPSGLIMEMPFGSLQQHLEGRARTLGFPGEPFGFLVTFWIGVERGFNGYKHRTARYAKNVNCPVLLQWGADDTYVTKSEVENVFHNLATTDKKLVIYENAGHESLLRKNTDMWRMEVESFLKRNTK